MHSGTTRFKALKRLLSIKGIEIENWADKQAEKMIEGDKIALVKALKAMGLTETQIENILDKIILCEVPKEIRLEGKGKNASRIGGLIVRTKNGHKILFPKDRLHHVGNKQYLGDLLHEVVELDLIQKGYSVETAHEIAIEVRNNFLQEKRIVSIGSEVNKQIVQDNVVVGAMHQEDNKASAINRLKDFIVAIRKGKYQKGAILDLRNITSDKEIILVGDLHAKKDNLEKILSKNNNSEKIKNGNAILIILGDAVHSETNLAEMDSSVDIMQFIMNLKIQNPDNVYYLLGNHDYLSPMFSKGGVVQGIVYKDKLLELFGKEYVALYENFIGNSPLLAIGQGFIGIHAGPIRDVNLEDIQNADVADEGNEIVYQAEWNRFSQGDYNEADVNYFLQRMGQPAGNLIVGHSPRRDGDWHWQLLPNHHIIFAGHDRCGYAVVRNGLVDFVEAPASSEEPMQRQTEPLSSLAQKITKAIRKVEKLGGNRQGGELKTRFTNEVWIEAGSVAYKVWVEQGIVSFQRYDKKEGDAQGRLRQIKMDVEFQVGREDSFGNDYLLPSDRTLSRRHFKIRVSRAEGDAYNLAVNDLNSLNGTTVEWNEPKILAPSQSTEQEGASREVAKSADPFPTQTTELKPGENTFGYQLGTRIEMVLGIRGEARDTITLTRDERTGEYAVTYHSQEIRFKSGETITVGRYRDRRVVIDPSAVSVSRAHMEITAKEDTIIINDTSTFGTRVQNLSKIVGAMYEDIPYSVGSDLFLSASGTEVRSSIVKSLNEKKKIDISVVKVIDLSLFVDADGRFNTQRFDECIQELQTEDAKLKEAMQIILVDTDGTLRIDAELYLENLIANEIVTFMTVEELNDIREGKYEDISTYLSEQRYKEENVDITIAYRRDNESIFGRLEKKMTYVAVEGNPDVASIMLGLFYNELPKTALLEDIDNRLRQERIIVTGV